MAQVIELSNRDIAVRVLRVSFGDFLCNYTDEDIKNVESEIEYLYEVGVDPESEINLCCFKDEKHPRCGPLWSFLGFIHDGYGEYIFGDSDSSEDLWSLVPKSVYSAFDKIQRNAINHAAKIVNKIIEKRMGESNGITEEERKERRNLILSIEMYETKYEEREQEDIKSAISETMRLRNSISMQ